MPADRFYFDGPIEQSTSAELEGPEHHHLGRVMRVAAGEEVEIINGRGALAIAKVTHIHKEKTGLYFEKVSVSSPSISRIVLAIPYMRPAKLEWVLEKAVELDAAELRLYMADYSEKGQLSVNALDRLKNLTVSALKQSGRLFLPSFECLSSLEEALKIEGTLLFGDTRPHAKNLLRCDLQKSVLFASGPERGFSSDERKLLDKLAIGVSLSPNILRAETAPLAALSVISLMQSTV